MLVVALVPGSHSLYHLWMNVGEAKSPSELPFIIRVHLQVCECCSWEICGMGPVGWVGALCGSTLLSATAASESFRLRTLCTVSPNAHHGCDVLLFRFSRSSLYNLAVIYREL